MSAYTSHRCLVMRSRSSCSGEGGAHIQHCSMAAASLSPGCGFFAGCPELCGRRVAGSEGVEEKGGSGAAGADAQLEEQQNAQHLVAGPHFQSLAHEDVAHT